MLIHLIGLILALSYYEVEATLDRFVWTLYGHGLRVHNKNAQAESWHGLHPIHFFVGDQKLLTMEAGNLIMNELKRTIPKGGQSATTIVSEKMAQTVKQKGKVYDYKIFPANEQQTYGNTGAWLYHYQRKTINDDWTFVSRKKVKVSKEGWGKYTKDNPFSLREFMISPPFVKHPGEVFWIACRERITPPKDCNHQGDCTAFFGELCCKTKGTPSKTPGKCIQTNDCGTKGLVFVPDPNTGSDTESVASDTGSTVVHARAMNGDEYELYDGYDDFIGLNDGGAQRMMQPKGIGYANLEIMMFLSSAIAVFLWCICCISVMFFGYLVGYLVKTFSKSNGNELELSQV